MTIWLFFLQINALLSDPTLLSGTGTDTDLFPSTPSAFTSLLDSAVSRFLEPGNSSSCAEEDTLFQQAVEATALEKRHTQSVELSEESLRKRVEELRKGVKFQTKGTSSPLGPAPKPIDKGDLEEGEDETKGWCCMFPRLILLLWGTVILFCTL